MSFLTGFRRRRDAGLIEAAFLQNRDLHVAPLAPEGDQPPSSKDPSQIKDLDEHGRERSRPMTVAIQAPPRFIRRPAAMPNTAKADHRADPRNVHRDGESGVAHDQDDQEAAPGGEPAEAAAHPRGGRPCPCRRRCAPAASRSGLCWRVRRAPSQNISQRHEGRSGVGCNRIGSGWKALRRPHGPENRACFPGESPVLPKNPR